MRGKRVKDIFTYIFTYIGLRLGTLYGDTHMLHFLFLRCYERLVPFTFTGQWASAETVLYAFTSGKNIQMCFFTQKTIRDFIQSFTCAVQGWGRANFTFIAAITSCLTTAVGSLPVLSSAAAFYFSFRQPCAVRHGNLSLPCCCSRDASVAPRAIISP